MKRSQYPEFLELVNSSDIICLSETKTDDFDQIEIPGYTFRFKNRISKTRVKSGGIAFGFKNNLEKFIQPIETSSNLVYWFKLSAEYVNLDSDLIVGCIYIPQKILSIVIL